MKLRNLIIFTFAFFMFCAFTHSAKAQPTRGNTGLGVVVGEPTGISFKSWTSSKNALVGGLAWSLGRYDAINIHADYLWYNYNFTNEINTGSLLLHYGIGGRLSLAENDALIGVRVPLGIDYYFQDTPLELFIEIAPVINLIPVTDFDVNGGLGIRYYFQ